MAVDVTGTTEEQKSLEREKEDRKFLEQQYIALRSEIEQASERAFKIFAASVLVVPTGLTLGSVAGAGEAGAGDNVLPLIKMLLPLLLLAFYAMYSAQEISTRRAGLYISSYIEPRLLGGRTRGWESWLSDRRYAYDAQMNIAFFSLSAVYYLGSVYFAVTADLTRNSPLRHFKEFLNFQTPGLPTLPSETMLFIFYALAGLVMLFLVRLVPIKRLEEEEGLKRMRAKRKYAPDTPERTKSKFVASVRALTEATQKVWRVPFYKRGDKRWVIRVPFYKRGDIKNFRVFDTESSGPSGHVPGLGGVRLTVGQGLSEITTVVGIVTLTLLIVWAASLIYWFFYTLAQLPPLIVSSILPKGVVLVGVGVLTVLVTLVLLALLIKSYDRYFGNDIGAKIEISFQGADGGGTEYIVRASLDKQDYDIWADKKGFKKMIEGKKGGWKEKGKQNKSIKTKPDAED